jgi:hypothetical protein
MRGVPTSYRYILIRQDEFTLVYVPDFQMPIGEKDYPYDA